MIRAGDRIGHIRVDGHLADGGMGAVFTGFDERLERPVALKAIHRDRMNAEARARFLVEARLLSQLDHPNICRIHGYLEDEAGEFLVLELIRGRTLRQALRDGIDPGARLAIAEGVTRALEAAHEKGIIHRDLKPGNVMLVEGGGVKVLDFGLARLDKPGAVDETGSRSGAPVSASPATGDSWMPWMPSRSGSETPGALIGTASSMSPEQARGEPATAASDAYALGLLLQELCTGRPPFEPGLSEAMLLVKAADGDTLPVEGVRDPDLAALIRRLKALAPEARPTVSAAAERLVWIRGKPRRRRLRLLAAAVAAAFLLGGAKHTLDLREERRLALEARRAAEQQAVRADTVARFLEDLFKASTPRSARASRPPPERSCGVAPSAWAGTFRTSRRCGRSFSTPSAASIPSSASSTKPGRCWWRRSPSASVSTDPAIRTSRRRWPTSARWPASRAKATPCRCSAARSRSMRRAPAWRAPRWPTSSTSSARRSRRRDASTRRRQS